MSHRNIIDVFGFGELPDGRQCIVMEYLDGESLEAVLKAHALAHRVMKVQEVLVILDEILAALAAAHTAGVIHRDLKPSNIFLCRQRDGAQYVKLLDFGIAKLGVLGSPTPQTRASLLMGTPSYMAPEQARGGAVSPGMDLYALGVIAYEMLTGRLPFTAETVVEMLLKHANEEPRAEHSRRAGRAGVEAARQEAGGPLPVGERRARPRRHLAQGAHRAHHLGRRRKRCPGSSCLPRSRRSSRSTRTRRRRRRRRW